MRATGVADYQGFALDLLATIQDRPISFEVFATTKQRWKIRRGTSRRGQERIRESSGDEYERGANLRSCPRPFFRRNQIERDALLTLEQVRHVCSALKGNSAAYVSVFAGRIADTGRDRYR